MSLTNDHYTSFEKLMSSSLMSSSSSSLSNMLRSAASSDSSSEPVKSYNHKIDSQIVFFPWLDGNRHRYITLSSSQVGISLNPESPFTNLFLSSLPNSKPYFARHTCIICQHSLNLYIYLEITVGLAIQTFGLTLIFIIYKGVLFQIFK